MANAVFISVYSQRWGPREELGVEYVASRIKESGRDVEIVVVGDDGESGYCELEDSLRRLEPVLVGIGCSHAAIDIVKYQDLSRFIKDIIPSSHISCGGYFATFNARRLLEEWSELDSVMAGEGEETALDLIRLLEQEKHPDSCLGLHTRTNTFKPRTVIQDLDKLPYPLREAKGLPQSDLLPLSTSRGCMAHCTFCNVPKWTKQYGGGWRGRSPINVVDEMEKLYFAKHARRFWIVDSSYEDPYPDGFTRIQGIAEEIMRRKLPISYYVFFRAESLVRSDCRELLQQLISSGLRRVFIGIESGNDEELRRYGKRANLMESKKALGLLRDLGIPIRIGFIMFNPYSTFQALRANLDFLKSEQLLASTADLLTRLELYTGSVEIDRLKKDNLLTGDPWNDPYAYRFLNPEIGRMAVAVSSIRALNSSQHRWEAIHMAKLVVYGALNTKSVMEHDVLHDEALELQKNINELCDILEATNEAFFLELLELARLQWCDGKFGKFVEKYIDGYQVQIAATCDALVRAFLLTSRKHKVNVLF